MATDSADLEQIAQIKIQISALSVKNQRNPWF